MNYKKIIWGKGEKCYKEIPKVIWIYWNSPNYPPLVDICISQLKNLLIDFEINITNDNNLNEFLPNIHLMRKDLPLANYSDLIRLELLQKYGGYYLDASVLITKNLDWIIKIKQEDNSDLVGFYSDSYTIDWDFPLLETWFIATTPQNKFITAWTEEFKKCYTSTQPHQYFNQENFLFLDKYLNHYLIAYLAAAKIMRNNSNFRLSMISANNVGHYYNFEKKLLPHKLQEIFLFNKEEPFFIPNLIKFEKAGRTAIDEALNNGRYSKNSLLFKIAPQQYSLIKRFLKLPQYYIFIIKNILKKYAK